MENLKPKIVLIDVGTHKCEELCVLLNSGFQAVYLYFKWLAQSLKKIRNWTCENKNYGWLSIREHMQIIAHLFRKPYDGEIVIIAIEPNSEIVVSYLNKLKKKYSTIYFPIAILGHDSDRRCGLEKFFVYKDDLSNSLYLKKHLGRPLKANLVFSVRFRVLLDELLKFDIINNHDKVVLRMNCEGAELGILRDCLNSKVKLECIMGSIADIAKIHGNDARMEGDILMKKMGASFCYFKGSDPTTWLSAKAALENIRL